MTPPLPWLVMLAGYSVTGFAAFWSDFRKGQKVSDLVWCPALASAAWFYWSAHSLFAVEKALVISAPVALAGLLIVYLGAWIGQKGMPKAEGRLIGQADVIAFVVLAFWPTLILWTVVAGSSVLFVVNIRHRYAPKLKLAGVLGLVSVPVALCLVFL